MRALNEQLSILKPVPIRIMLLLLLSIGLPQSGKAQPPPPKFVDGIGPVLRLDNVEFVEINAPDSAAEARQLIVFVHGTPGSLSTFSAYLNDPLMRENFHMISVTRPGWLADGDPKQPSLEEQARALQPLLGRDRSGKGAILMGHSYGGPVIARVAMDYSELVAGLVFVASSGDPELSGPRWYNRLAVVLPGLLLGESLKGANAEIMPLQAQLQAMQPRWQDLTMPVLLVQGMQDRLVNPGNADFIEQSLVNADVTSLIRNERGHFVLWQEADLIRSALLKKFGYSKPAAATD